MAVISVLQKIFGLTKNQSIAYLVAIIIFGLIGIFVKNSSGDYGAYLLSLTLVAVNGFVLSLARDIERIRLALLVFFFVLNIILFGYYYFNSITIF